MTNDRSHLTPKKITDKNGKQTTVHVNEQKGDGSGNADKLGGVAPQRAETLHEKQQRVGGKIMKDVKDFMNSNQMYKNGIDVFVDRGEEMSDKEVIDLFHPGDDARERDGDNFYDASRYDLQTATGDFLLTQKDNKELLDALGIDPEELDYSHHDYDAQNKMGELALNDSSFESDVLRDTMTDYLNYDEWARDRLSGKKEFMGVPFARYQGDYINGLSEGADERKAAWIESELRKTGYEPTDEDKKTIMEIAENGPYDYHEGVTAEVFWRGEVLDLEPLEPATGEERLLSFEKPNILVMDSGNGTGYDAMLEKPHSFKARVPFFDEDEGVTERKSEGKASIRLDRDRGGYSWDETAGLAPGAEAFDPPEVEFPVTKERDPRYVKGQSAEEDAMSEEEWRKMMMWYPDSSDFAARRQADRKRELQDGQQ